MNRVNDAPHHSALSGGQGDPVHPARALAARWQQHLSRERRRSEHTVRAYAATAHRLIDFLGDHLGGAVGFILLYRRGWYRPPALHLGGLDRVWVPFATFELPQGLQPIRGRMHNIRLIGGISTYGSPW